MSQQPYGQPHYPGYPPPQQYAPPVQQPYPPQPIQQGYPQQAPQQYAPPVQQQAPAPPLADGSLDAFYSQPNTGGGPGVSWKGKPDGYTIQGTVPRDVTNADVTQEVGAPNTQQAGIPQTYRDGRPKFVMAVPLQLPQSQEYPEGEARLFVRGQLRDELARAMSEAGVSGAPTAGAVITVTLVQRKQGRGTIPQNVFAVNYTPAGGQAPQVQPAAQPTQQPVQQFQPQQAPAQQQYAAPQAVPQYQPPAQQPAQQAAAPQYAPQQAQPGIPQGAQPVQPQGGMQMPPGFDPEQQALFARIAAGQTS